MAWTRIKARGSDGRVAVYTGPSRTMDDVPFNTPLLDLPTLLRVKYHSAFAYPKVLQERSFNVSFPARTWVGTDGNWYADKGTFPQSYQLFAHGRPGRPWILGSALVGGRNVAFTGSVPVQIGLINSSGGLGPWARWVSIGADETHVYAFEYTIVPWDRSTKRTSAWMPAITIPIKVWLSNKILLGAPANDPVSSNVAIRILPNRSIFNEGKFDTNARYLREVESGELSTMLAGPSLAMVYSIGASNLIAWRYTCGDYNVQGVDTASQVVPAVVNTPTKFIL